MKLFVQRDLDGFFGLFVDNLVQLLAILFFCGTFCGMTGTNARFLYELILPGAALSIFVGNLFYAWQAHRLARKEQRDDVTALPYGINTPSLIVYVFFVMKPEFDRTGSVDAAWKMGLIACLGSGVIEFVGSFVAERIRRCTPRAALLSTLAGIAIGFISMTFALQIFHKPLVALLPLVIVLMSLFGGVQFPGSVPGGFVAVTLGAASAWILTLLQGAGLPLPDWATFGAMNPSAVSASLESIGPRLPLWCGDVLWESIRDVGDWLPLLSVIVPMGLFNVIGSLQNIESAEAAGDRYSTASSMAVNGLGTIVAALFGSCFPTTLYIGHPGWKALGARAGYSSLNGLVMMILALTGLVGTIGSVVPIEAGAAIVLWIGIIITAQAFQSTPDKHGPAVAVGLFPAIAAWGATVMLGTITVAGGQNLYEIVVPQRAVAAAEEGDEIKTADTIEGTKSPTEVNGFLVSGLLMMERGYIFTCMILSAAVASLIDRKFVVAAVWMFCAAFLTGLGVMHAYQIYGGSAFDYLFCFAEPVEGAYAYRAIDVAIGYAVGGLMLLLAARWAGKSEVSGH